MKEKKSFLIYFDWESAFECFDEKELGTLFKALFFYAKNGEMPKFENKALVPVFKIMASTITRDVERYEERCRKNAENIKKRWESQKSKSDSDECIRPYTIHTDIDIDKDKDRDKDRDRDRDKDRDKDRDINNKSTSSFSAKKESAYSEDFLIFWGEYPKKVGKGAAFKAWKKMKLSRSEKDDIISALKWQKKSSQWKNSGGRFIPNPSTYINQRRWEDEPCETLEADITDPSRYTDGDVLPDYIMRGDY